MIGRVGDAEAGGKAARGEEDGTAKGVVVEAEQAKPGTSPSTGQSSRS